VGFFTKKSSEHELNDSIDNTTNKNFLLSVFMIFY
jgi:hypothetical protein